MRAGTLLGSTPRPSTTSPSGPTGTLPPNRHYFAPIKDLSRAAVRPQIVVSQVAPNRLSVELKASAGAYVFFTHLLTPHEHTRYSDNYFDLEPGEQRTIDVTNDAVALTPDMVTLGWR